MPNLNKVMLIGNLTRDPETRATTNSTITELGIAVNRSVKDDNGGWKDETTFVNVTVWGKTAENCAKFLTKGRGVFIEGRLQMDTWDDKGTGAKRTKLKVVADTVQFLGTGGSRKETPGTTAAGGPSSTQAGWDHDTSGEDDDIPF